MAVLADYFVRRNLLAVRPAECRIWSQTDQMARTGLQPRGHPRRAASPGGV